MALPDPVAAVCKTFLSAVPDDLVTGLYLRGGIGFGEWIDGKSDIDFFATLARRPSENDVAALRTAHEQVSSAHPEPFFDGAHVLASDLAASPADCPDVPTVMQHAFHECGRHEISPVGWHELARHGVTVTGPLIETLGIWTDDVILRAHTIGNLDTYWRGQAESCAAHPEIAASDAACEWVVPGVARLHFLLVTGEQTTKSRAARWGLGFYPERFHPVLREALRLREGSGAPEYASVVDRGADVAALAAYVIRQTGT